MIRTKVIEEREPERFELAIQGYLATLAGHALMSILYSTRTAPNRHPVYSALVVTDQPPEPTDGP